MQSQPFGEVMLTVKEVAALGRSERRVLLNKEAWRAKPNGTGRNGKPVYLFPLNGLPEELRRAYLQSQLSSQDADDPHGLDNIDANPEIPDNRTPAEIDRELRLTRTLQRLPLDVREAFLDEARRLKGIVEAYLALANKRQRVASLEIAGASPAVRVSSAGYEFTPAVHNLCRQTPCTNQVIINYFRDRQHSIRKGTEPRCARPISPSTLDHWSQRLRKEGLVIFLPTPPAKATSSDDDRLAKMSKDAYEWLLKNFRNHPTVTQCYYRWQKAAGRHNWRIPSAGWLKRWYRDNIPPVARAAIFLGGKVYTDKYKPFLPRTVRDLEALQLLCGDHHVLDVHCWSESKKSLVRLWFTAWLDLRTYLLYGWHLDYTPSSTTIGCSYANGVRMFGAQPPRREGFQSRIYVDNGKDYRSRNVDGRLEVHQQAAALDGGLELLLTDRGVGLAQDVDIQPFLARKYNGREKPLERVFRDLADYLQNEFFRRGWCGRNTKDRPDFYGDLYTRHLKAIKAGKPSPFPLESEVRAAVIEFVDKHNTTAHQRTVLDGLSTVPIQEYQSLYSTRYDIREQTLALLVMKKTAGSLGKNGVAALGSHYWSDDLAKFKGKKDKDGKSLRIEIRYTDADYSTAWLVLPDGVIVPAVRVDLNSIITPNKENMTAYANRVKGERDLIKRAGTLQQSVWRGESTWDRIAAEIEPAEEVVEAVAAVGGSHAPVSSGVHYPARVHQLTRLDRLRVGGNSRTFRPVTVDQVAAAEVDESIFCAEGKPDNVVSMWEDEEDVATADI